MSELLLLQSGALTIRKSPVDMKIVEGMFFGEDGFSGWDDGATMRSYTSPRPQAHGDFDSRGYLSGRMMAISGWAVAQSPEKLLNFRDLFIGHGAEGERFTVAVTRNGQTRSAVARLAVGDVPTFVDNGTGLRARWAASWWLPDPYKFGARLATSGIAQTVEIINRGNVPARPRLRVRGNRPSGYTITGPDGQQIIVTRALASGTYHDFNLGSARFAVDGTRVLNALGVTELFTIPIGRSTISVSSGATLEVIGNETFL